jgi:hypothetical protein
MGDNQQSQAERAALLAHTANNFMLKLESGRVKLEVLNGHELTTAYYPWIFNSVRIPRIGSDEMRRYPGEHHCVVFWRGHAFQVGLSMGDRQATYLELFITFSSILSQPKEPSLVAILTSDDRHPWAETRQRLRQLNPKNTASIETIEAADFLVCLDEAAPKSAVERARQFHFGGENGASNRWHDKSIQFIVYANGVSGTVGEHNMLDVMTPSGFNEDIATATSSDVPKGLSGPLPDVKLITPVHLPLETDAALTARIETVRTQYRTQTKGAEHSFFLFEGYGSSICELIN